VFQHANRISSAPYYKLVIICCLCGSVIFFHIISEKIVEYEKFLLIFSTMFSEKFLNLRIIQRDIIKNFH
jgi:hypothetical protein